MLARLFAVAVAGASLCAVDEPKTIYVDQGVAASGDGTSWETAVKTIQEGVNKASTTEVDTILVAPGTSTRQRGEFACRGGWSTGRSRSSRPFRRA